MTYLLETGRGFIAGDAPHILGAFALGMGVAFWKWAFLGLRKAEAAGA